MKEFLQELGIYESGTTARDGSYVIDIPDSAIYGKYLSRLDRSDLVEEDPESSQFTSDNGVIQYRGEEYTVILLSDFESDTYKLVIRKN